MAKRLTKQEKQDIQDKDNLVAEMRKRHSEYNTAEQHNIDAALLDLKVLVGEQHWDETVENERKTDGRPCLVVNQLPVFTRQVIGDQRQSRPATQIIPSDNLANTEVAEIIEGKIREIKYKSKADSAHDNAYAQSVRSSFGYWRIKTDYEADDSFDQTIYIEDIPNQFAVKFDPAAQRWDKTDGNWLIVESSISKETFEQKYPDVEPVNADHVTSIGSEWYLEGQVRIVEYFKKRPKTSTLYQMESGNVVDNEDDLNTLLEIGDTVKKEREVEGYEIIRYLMCGHGILEDEQIWPSKYWPVVEVLGETINVNGKPYKRSLIRDAHDSQRSYNYAISSEVETFSLAPKTPILATPKQLQGHESSWKQAHKRTYPFLYSNPDPAAPGWPQRVEAPQLSTAITAFRQETKQTLRDTIGIFDAGLGNQSNEVSGVAIEGRKRESDTGTYIFLDNLQYALELEDRIILDLLPKIFDTNRHVMTRGVDGTSNSVEINKPVVKDGLNVIENDFTKGKYDVVVTMGPTFSTQRQEARNNMLDLIGKVPAIAPFVLDKLVRSMDFHDAQDIARRLVVGGVVPAGVLNEDEKKDMPAEPAGPPPPDPLVLAQVQLADTQGKLNLAKAEKALADIMKIKEDLEVQQSEMTMKVMQAIEQRLSGMTQSEGQQGPPTPPGMEGYGVG